MFVHTCKYHTYTYTCIHMHTHAYVNTRREYLCWWQWGVIGVGGSSFWQEARQRWLPWGQSQCTFLLLQINLFSIIWLIQTHLYAVGMVDRQALKPFALTIKPPKAGLMLVPNPSPTLISLTSYLTFELCREKREGLVQLLRQLQGVLDF